MQIEKKSQCSLQEVQNSLRSCEENLIPTAEPEDNINTALIRRAPSKQCKWYTCTGIFASIAGLLMICGIILLSTLPNRPSGAVMVGNSDSVLISVSFINEVRLDPVGDVASTNFYQDVCSNIGPYRQLQNSTIQLNISDNMQYAIDEPYLSKGSEVHYSIYLASDSHNNTLPCRAQVLVFRNRASYLEFLLTGDVSTQASSGCITSNGVSYFKVAASQLQEYFFIGLEGLSSTTLNYTIIRDVLEYNITNLSSTLCTFSTPCSISLDYPGGQEVCVLASLQESDFITLNYFTVSYRYNMQFTAALVFNSYCIWYNMFCWYRFIIIFFFCMQLIKVPKTTPRARC